MPPRPLARRPHPRPATAGVALLTLAAACGDPAAPLPAVRPAAYDLVFEGDVAGGQRHVFRAAAEASAFGTPALFGRGIAAGRPAPSRDGRRLLVQWTHPDRTHSTVAVVDETMASPVPVGSGTDEIEGEPTWAPDGRRFAFLSQGDDPAGDILVGTLRGTRLEGVRNLTPRDPGNPYPQPDRTPAWSPDGARIAFTTYRAGGAAIWTMAPDGAGARPVTAAGQYGDYSPSWSPDGRWIAFQRVDASTVRIGIVAAEGGAPRFLPWPAKAYAPAWSPDGARIAFSSDVDGDMDVYVVTPDGAELARVRRPGADRNPAWLRR
jgi:Tol biopolymer transport system component